MIDIKKPLAVLGIKDVNPGASTGEASFGGGEEIASYSPVDGKLIGIKGQYLMIDNDRVFNVRSHQGYIVDCLF